MGIFEKRFAPDTPEKVDFWLRLLDIITATSAQSIEAYTVDREMGIDRPLNEYETEIHQDDKLAINSLISIFELISKKID
jgi:hypothetical protein